MLQYVLKNKEEEKCRKNSRTPSWEQDASLVVLEVLLDKNIFNTTILRFLELPSLVKRHYNYRTSLSSRAPAHPIRLYSWFQKL